MNHSTQLSTELEALAQRVATLVAEKLSYTTPNETLGIAEVMPLLNCRARSTAYRTLAALQVRAYLPGKYRRRDVENAIARMSRSRQL